MSSPPINERRGALWLVLGVTTLALAAILVPFWGTLLWSVIIGLLFHPLFRWLVPRMGGRRTAAALLTLLVVLFIVVLPFALLTFGLINEAVSLYAQLQSSEIDPGLYFRQMFGALPDWALRPLQSIGLGDFEALQRRITALLSQAGQFFAAQAVRIGQNTFDMVTALFIMLYISFFLIRDGSGLVKLMRQSVPISMEHQRELTRKFTTVIRATVKGNLLVAALQGALGGIAFWFLDLRGALLWAVLMAFLSLLPAVGAAIVWVPVALYFLSTGDVGKGVALAVWGVVVIGLVDNLLRPILVGKDTRLPDWVVLITTLGGIAVFGINGFVLGPVIAAMFFAAWPIAVMEPGRPVIPSPPRPVPPTVETAEAVAHHRRMAGAPVDAAVEAGVADPADTPSTDSIRT